MSVFASRVVDPASSLRCCRSPLIINLSCVDWCVEPRINMLSEPSVYLFCHQYLGQYPQEISWRCALEALNSQPQEFFKLYLHFEFGCTPQFCMSCSVFLLLDKGTLDSVSLVFPFSS